MDFNKLLSEAMSMGASDIHLKPGIMPVVRYHGQLRPLGTNHERLTAEDIKKIAYSIMSENQKKLFEENKELDMGYGVPSLGRFRVNIFQQRGTLGIVIRAITSNIPTFDALNLPPVLEKIVQNERGLVLVTGATGSGKSTTLASMINSINYTKNCHIVTIEDPIEYLLKDKKSIISQRELGADTKSFAAALRAALRQDPDVILIGEMRDRETIETALIAAETGHLVLSTLHTADTRESINRILSTFEPHQQTQVRIQLASVLRAVISQRLGRRSDKKGLVPAVEILITTARIREMIMDPKRTHDILKAIEEGYTTYGMQSFDQSLLALVTKGLMDYQEALQLSSSAENFALRAKGVTSVEGKKYDNFDKRKAPGSVKSDTDPAHEWDHIPKLELAGDMGTDDPEKTDGRPAYAKTGSRKG